MFDPDIVVRAIEHIHADLGPGAVLVFLSGWDEISKVLDGCRDSPVLRGCQLLPLHGGIPTEQQRQVFARPPEGQRKVILSTNIAETSITIDDIVYVVDGGKSKQTSYDALNKLAVLQPDWVSKAAAHQRRGRAGRVQAGTCLRLYPRWLHDGKLIEHTPPELLRTPLEGLILQIKSLGMPCAKSFLSNALEPPEPRAVDNALDLLETIGAIELVAGGARSAPAGGERLTSLGRHLATLPVDPRVGKMLVIGAVFGQAEAAAAMAAALAYRDPFVLPMDKKAQADAARERMAAGTVSDHVALLNALVGFQEARARYGRGGAERYARENFLSSRTLGMIEDMADQFMSLLRDIGFVSSRGGRRGFGGSTLKRLDASSPELPLMRAIVAAGLYPSVAAVGGKRFRTKFHTREDGGAVEAHPSSIASRTAAVDFAHDWLVYGEKVKTANIFLRDSTMVSNYTLLLLGGAMDARIDERSGDTTYALLGGYVQFTVDSRTAQLVGALRARLDELLAAKLADARLDVGPGGREIVHAIDELLRSESARADARRDYERQELERRTAERRQRREGRYQRQEQRY